MCGDRVGRGLRLECHDHTMRLRPRLVRSRPDLERGAAPLWLYTPGARPRRDNAARKIRRAYSRSEAVTPNLSVN